MIAQKIPIIFIPLILTGILCVAQVKNDLLRQNIKGKVYHAVKWEYYANGNSEKPKEKKLKRKTVYEFNEQGNLVRITLYNSKNIFTEYYIYLYDENGKRTIGYKYGYEEKLLDFDSSIYNENNDRIKTKSFNPDGSLYEETYMKYDNNGQVTEVLIYNDENKLTSRYTFKHDAAGSVVESDYHGKDSTLLETYTYKYYDFDKKGNWRKLITYNKNGVINGITIFRIEYY